MTEFPMYSPNPRGLHYSKFSHKDNMELSRGYVIVNELNSYHNYDTFKWVFEETPQEGSYQPMNGLAVSDGYATIRTNSVAKFKKGDILFLKWAACPEGRLYIITDAGLADYIYTPKPRQAFQRLELRKLV